MLSFFIGSVFWGYMLDSLKFFNGLADFSFEYSLIRSVLFFLLSWFILIVILK